MRNVHIDDYEDIERDIVAVGNDYASGYILKEHSHARVQVLYGATGIMHVTTASGSWTVPPQHAVLIPSRMPHSVQFIGVSTRSLYIKPEVAGTLFPATGCRVFIVSPLLRQLLIEAVSLDPLYDSVRDSSLVTLLLLELAKIPTRQFDIPLPQEAALRQRCLNFLRKPVIQARAEQWARDLCMSDSTFRRHFIKQTGISFLAWRQRACVVVALSKLVEGAPVNEVALSMGYDSSSAFSTMFRRITIRIHQAPSSLSGKGKLIVMSSPPLAGRLARMWPSCASQISLAIESPSPLPPESLARERSPRVKRSKIWGR